GSGGTGGAAGKLITIFDTQSGDALRVVTSGGAGGAGGARPRMNVISSTNTVVSSQLVGPTASTGAAGPAGWRDDLLTGGIPYDYLFAFGRRGADRLLANGLSFASAVHVPGAPATNVATARGQ